MREDITQVVELFINCTLSGKFDQIPLAPDVVFESPLTPKLTGRIEVIRFLADLRTAILDLRVRQHIVEGEYCATLYDWVSVYGVVPIFGRFHIQGGVLKSVRTFHDLRLLSELIVKPATA